MSEERVYFQVKFVESEILTLIIFFNLRLVKTTVNIDTNLKEHLPNFSVALDSQ